MKLKNATILLTGIFISGAVLAQQPILEEVIVSASKRDVSLDDLAGAANVLGSDELGSGGGVTSVRDMNVNIPNLSIGDQFGFARVFMRGIGMTSIDIGGEGAVAFLQDGAIIPRPASQLMGMFDLEQIEVLRGPQGTLYGRGATAGVINLVTAKPGGELGSYARVTMGDYALRDLEGGVNVPISDAFGLRLSAKLERRDGYGENIFSGEEVDDRDADSYRLTAIYDAGKGFNAVFSAQSYEEDDHNFAFHYFGPSEGNPTGPLAVAFLNGKTVSQAGGGFYDINSDQEAINTREGDNYTLTLGFDLSERTTLKSVTSRQSMERFLRDDLDSTDVNLFGQNNYTEESDSFGQEFILNFSDDRRDVVAGLMYFEEELYGQVLVPLTAICNLPTIMAPCGTPSGNTVNSGKYEQNGTVDIEAWGAFFEASYQVTDKLRLTGGLRYNEEERKGKGAFIFDALGVNTATDAKDSWDELTPRITLEYSPLNDLMLYATYNKAFKSGVINTGSTSPPLDPETVDAFEVGAKGLLNNGRLRYSVAAFLYNYENLQISFVNAASTVETINAAEAENYGLEGELEIALTESLSMDLYATYLSAEYEEFINHDYSDGFSRKDLKGNTLPNAPEHTFKLGINHVTEIGGGELILRAEYYHQDDVYFTEWNRKDAFQKAHGLLNARASYVISDVTVTLWGRNLTDEEVVSNNIITAPLYNSLRVGSLLPPRTYGATVEYQF